MPEENDIFAPDIQYLVFRKCTPQWALEPHIVSNYDITYVIKGGARYIINDQKYELSAGDLLCLSDGCKKEALTYPDRLMRCFSVNFLTGKPEAPPPPPFPFPLISHIGLKNDIIRLFDDMVYTWTNKQPGYVMKSRGLMLLILHRFFELLVYNRDTGIGDYRVKQSVHYIIQNYAERLTVKKLAARAKLNPAYFGVLFKRETGFSVPQYIALVRIRNAENLLRSGEYRVKEVAAHCGYSDAYHFYSQFKTITGVSPSRRLPNCNGKSIFIET
jgi:AraC-like DNA-binding protein